MYAHTLGLTETHGLQERAEAPGPSGEWLSGSALHRDVGVLGEPGLAALSSSLLLISSLFSLVEHTFSKGLGIEVFFSRAFMNLEHSSDVIKPVTNTRLRSHTCLFSAAGGHVMWLPVLPVG